MPEERKYTLEEIEAAAGFLRSMRIQLLCVPTEMLQQLIRAIDRDEAVGCFFDPTSWLKRDRKDLLVQKEAAEKLLELKAIWSGDEELLHSIGMNDVDIQEAVSDAAQAAREAGGSDG